MQKLKDLKVPELEWFDEVQLQFVDIGLEISVVDVPIYDCVVGDKAKDSITGFSGILYGITEWFSGNVRVMLYTDKLNKETGNPIGTCEFDLARIVSLEKKVIPKPAKRTFGPQNDPSKY